MKSKFNLEIFMKRNFCVSIPKDVATFKDLSIDVRINYYCKTDTNKAIMIYFLRVRTDKLFQNPHMQKVETWHDVSTQEISAQSSELGVSWWLQYASQYNRTATLFVTSSQ